MRLTRATKGLVLAASVVAALAVPASASAKVSRVVEADLLWSYNGGLINPQLVIDKGLHCFDDEDSAVTRCYDSISELESAEHIRIDGGATQATGVVRSAKLRKRIKRRRVRARAATHAGPALTLYDYWYNSGWSWSTTTYGAWVNVHPILDNYASQLTTGNHSGCGALNYGGSGRYGRWSPSTDVNLTGTFADNATSSVARGDC